MLRNSIAGLSTYRDRLQSISPYVDWKPRNIKKLTPSDKRTISIYFHKIAKLRATGHSFKSVKNKKLRDKINHQTTRIKLPKLKGVWARVPPGAKLTVSAAGTVGWSRGSIARVQVGAQFFMSDDADRDEVANEAKRVATALRKALGKRRLDRVAVTYLGGDSATVPVGMLEDLLIIDEGTYGPRDGIPHVGIAGYRFKRPKGVAKQIDKLKSETQARNAKRRKAARGDV